jgi:hypothetical protein
MVTGMNEEQPMYVEFISGEYQSLIELPPKIITDAIQTFVQGIVDDDELLAGGEWRLLNPTESLEYHQHLDQQLNWYDNEQTQED